MMSFREDTNMAGKIKSLKSLKQQSPVCLNAAVLNQWGVAHRWASECHLVGCGGRGTVKWLFFYFIFFVIYKAGCFYI